MKKIMIALALTVTTALMAHDVVGGVVGGAIGGVIGNQFGGGNGKVVATIAGATLGTLIGTDDRGYQYNQVIYHKDYPVRTVYNTAPQQVIYTQPRIVHVEPVPVYYGWNDRGDERRFERREERREYRREDRDDRHEWHEWHEDDNLHDHR
jgi:uncharacterized protein YcfJ